MAVVGWAVESGFVRFGTTFALLACFTVTALAWVVAEVVMVKAFVARVTKIRSFQESEVRRTSMVMTHIAFVLWLIQEADDVLWRFHVSLKRNAIWIACGHHFQLVVGRQVLLKLFSFGTPTRAFGNISLLVKEFGASGEHIRIITFDIFVDSPLISSFIRETSFLEIKFKQGHTTTNLLRVFIQRNVKGI